MPAPVPSDDKPASARPTLLFRAGLAVAALAALLLLVADGNGVLRVAAVLAITSVVMIGLSITLRPDAAVEVRQLADEIDELRAELAAVAHSARQAAAPVQWSAEPAAARARVGEVRTEPVDEPPRAGRARVAAAGGDSTHRGVDEPEPEEAMAEHRPRRPAGIDHRPAGIDHRSAGIDHRPVGTDHRRAEGTYGRRAEDPGENRWTEDAGESRWTEDAGGSRRTGNPGEGRRRVEDRDDRPADRAADDHRRTGNGGRRRAEDSEDEREPAGHGTGRRRVPEPDEDRTGGDWYADEEPAVRPRTTSRYAERPAGGVYGRPPRSDGHDVRAGATTGPEAPPRPVGVVRHTETVHVTTRHTIVDGTARDPGPGSGYDRWTPPEEQPWTGHAPERADRWDGYPPREDSAPGRPRGSARPGSPPGHHDRSWDVPPTGPGPTEARSWSGAADRPGADGSPDWPGHGGAPEPGGPERRTPTGGRGRYGPGADERYGHPGGERPGAAGDDARSRRGATDRPGRTYPSADAGADDWSEVRAGGRWATVRDDGHGRELRMGERRAAMHADGSGAELRVEDHWAAVRQPRRGEPGDGYDRDEPGRGSGSEYLRRDDRGGHRPDLDRALPPGGVPVPEQWRPARGDRPAHGWSASDDPGPAHGWSTPSHGPESARWSTARGQRPAEDWPEPSPRREPGSDRYDGPYREHEGRGDDSPGRWR